MGIKTGVLFEEWMQLGQHRSKPIFSSVLHCFIVSEVFVGRRHKKNATKWLKISWKKN